MKNTYRCVVANMEMIEFNKDLLEELLAAAGQGYAYVGG